MGFNGRQYLFLRAAIFQMTAQFLLLDVCTPCMQAKRCFCCTVRVELWLPANTGSHRGNLWADAQSPAGFLCGHRTAEPVQVCCSWSLWLWQFLVHSAQHPGARHCSAAYGSIQRSARVRAPSGAGSHQCPAPGADSSPCYAATRWQGDCTHCCRWSFSGLPPSHSTGATLAHTCRHTDKAGTAERMWM